MVEFPHFYVIFIQILLTSLIGAFPLQSLQESPPRSREGMTLLRRSLRDEEEEEQIAVFAPGEGAARKFIWSKYSSARNLFGAGNPLKEIESVNLSSQDS